MPAEIMIGETAFISLPIAEVHVLGAGAVYCVMDVDSEGHWKVIYVDESGQKGITIDHHPKRPSWNTKSQHQNLWIAIKMMPLNEFTEAHRREYADGLIAYFDPPCNRK